MPKKKRSFDLISVNIETPIPGSSQIEKEYVFLDNLKGSLNEIVRLADRERTYDYDVFKRFITALSNRNNFSGLSLCQKHPTILSFINNKLDNKVKLELFIILLRRKELHSLIIPIWDAKQDFREFFTKGANTLSSCLANFREALSSGIPKVIHDMLIINNESGGLILKYLCGEEINLNDGHGPWNASIDSRLIYYKAAIAGSCRMVAEEMLQAEDFKTYILSHFDEYHDHITFSITEPFIHSTQQNEDASAEVPDPEIKRRKIIVSPAEFDNADDELIPKVLKELDNTIQLRYQTEKASFEAITEQAPISELTDIISSSVYLNSFASSRYAFHPTNICESKDSLDDLDWDNSSISLDFEKATKP